MSSISSALRQPLTRSFVVTQNSNNNELGAYYFSTSAVDAWVADKSDKSVVGSLVTIPTANYNSVIDNLNTTGVLSQRKTLMDLGKQVVIGNTVDSRLIVLRLVRSYEDADIGGDGFPCYIVVENNTTDPNNNAGRYTVRTARI